MTEPSRPVVIEGLLHALESAVKDRRDDLVADIKAELARLGHLETTQAPPPPETAVR